MIELLCPPVGILDLGDLSEKSDHLAEEARQLGLGGLDAARSEEDEGALGDEEGVDESGLELQQES